MPSSAFPPTTPTRASLRALIRQVAIGDTDLRMLCIDHLPELTAYFGNHMSYSTMLNTVIERIEPGRLLGALERCAGFAAGMAAYKHLLVYEPSLPAVAAESSSVAAQTGYVGAAAQGRVERPWKGPPPPKSAYDRSWYLQRTDEQARAHAALAAPGAPVVLQAPELFGKTWLLMHLLAELQTDGPTVCINLRTLGEESLSTF